MSLKTSSIREFEDLADEYFANVDEVEKILSSYGYEMKYKQIDSLIWMVVGTKSDEGTKPLEDCNSKVNVI